MRKALLAGSLSGLLLCLSFPNWSLFFLAWFGLVPYLWVAARARRSSEIVALHLVFCTFFYGGVLYWIPHVLVVHGGLNWALAILGLVLLVLILAVMQAPFALLFRWGTRRSPLVAGLAAPGFWILCELIRNFQPFGGFPWASLGYSQLPYGWIVQIADLGSVYLVSYVVVLVNSAILLGLGWGYWRLAASVFVLFGLLNAYGLYRLTFWDLEGDGRIAVGLAQGNIELRAPREHYAEKYFKTLARQFDEAVASGAQWVIFPEAQNPFRYDSDFYYREFWNSKVRQAEVFLLFNTTRTEGPDYFNSALLLSPDGEVVYRYDKIHLVPFGEYLPLAGLFGGAQALVAEVSSFRPGTGLETGLVSKTRFAPQICYEAIFPELARQGARKGAQVLVNITNDGWFGRTAAPLQHLQMAAFRSIEVRKPLLRAANTGITAMVTVRGEILQPTDIFQEALLVDTVSVNSVMTLFVALGFWPCYALIMVSVAGAMASARGSFDRKVPRKGRRK